MAKSNSHWRLANYSVQTLILGCFFLLGCCRYSLAQHGNPSDEVETRVGYPNSAPNSVASGIRIVGARPPIPAQQPMASPDRAGEPALRLAQAQRPVMETAPPDFEAPRDRGTVPESIPLPPPQSMGQEVYPIDLPTALALAGANNLQIAFMVERVREAAALRDRANVLWVPSLNAGLIYNNHAGRIQATEGEIIEASRNSLYAGAGAVVGGAPLNGGSGGPARMFVDLPLVDVLIEPLAARQVVRAANAQRAAVFNDTLLQVATAYLALLRAHSQVGIAQEAVNNAEVLARITADFAQAGEGLQADAQRVQAELASRRRDLLQARESVAVSSAELARLLRLDPALTLAPTEPAATPIDLVPDQMPLPDLIGTALASRPEVNQANAAIDETFLRRRQEQLRPWIPHLYAGFSGGGFGGGMGSSVRGFSDRTDFDVAAVWEWENFGFGNTARQRQQASVHRQARINANQVRDLVATEVSRSYHRVRLRRDQIETAQSQVAAALQSLQLNLDGIRGRALRPIEAQQAVTAVASARGEYLDSVVDFNSAQFELLRALGQPPAVVAEDEAR